MYQATSDNQTTQAEVNVDGSFSLAECKRERRRELYRTDLAYTERQRERQRERYQTDPAYAERQRERQRKRYQTDPAYAERKRKHERERRRELYQTDSAYAERQRERLRELRKYPAYAKRERERYHTDPAYAKRKSERQKELRKDPAYVEGQKIYKKTFRRIKMQTSNKKEAKKQAVIARERYLQSVNSAKNTGDLPLTSNLAKATQSSSKNSKGSAHPLFCRQAEGIFTVPIDPSQP
ncbi:hypothetical protein [Endozoicomonas sp. GU-1]|uniref:hypothetical protein n=1 Tax=Endozoicomonas sp. GU-1 TaxID=3009078 RepID=UPI0022B48D62|nr:hypothetical protein [Endozoicomonas sp. GU-1]WBA79748.1 hypothetical protein O2T12_15400 [Endozoicomonas sp. GU-1]WBA87333.1 hypothetical protein O3276_04670 [Endozoicomonas sp. GU-1]